MHSVGIPHSRQCPTTFGIWFSLVVIPEVGIQSRTLTIIISLPISRVQLFPQGFLRVGSILGKMINGTQVPC